VGRKKHVYKRKLNNLDFIKIRKAFFRRGGLGYSEGRGSGVGSEQGCERE
jgi:hypothetical protein